jgi:hypothetical protein
MPLGRELRRSFQGRRDPWNQGVRGRMAKAGQGDADRCVVARMHLKLSHRSAVTARSADRRRRSKNLWAST